MNDTLFYILNSRYIAKRTTIITTNYEDVDREAALQAHSLVRKEYLVERIGQRLRSRLMEMCVVVGISGSDMRRASRQELNKLIAQRPPGEP
jgi:DNA replication protein DnaC